MVTRFRLALLAVVALGAVGASTAAATPPLSDSLELTLEIYDLETSTACDFDVFADVTGLFERQVHVDRGGATVRQVETFRGEITWFTRDGEGTYSSPLVNRTVIEFPEGVGFFHPVRITVSGQHGGVFPVGGGPAGAGTIVYDGFMYSEWDGFVYTFADTVVSSSGSFAATTQRICDAVAA